MNDLTKGRTFKTRDGRQIITLDQPTKQSWRDVPTLRHDWRALEIVARLHAQLAAKENDR